MDRNLTRRDTKPSQTGNEQNAILTLQTALLQKALVHWPRRAAPLLEVNCGSGEFLPVLWRCGFDAVATEPLREMRELARKQSFNNYDVRGASAGDLPFEESSFDWAICHLREADEEGIRKCLQEVRRVCRRGLMVTFWNSLSLAGLAVSALRTIAAPHAVLGWFKLHRIVKSCQLGQSSAFFTLYGPRWLWTQLARRHSGTAPRLPFGAWGIVRISFDPGLPVTPMGLHLTRQMRPRHETVLEFDQGNGHREVAAPQTGGDSGL